MSGIKRRISRQQGKNKGNLRIGAYIKDGDINITMMSGNWIGGTGVENTGLPDCNLIWLRDKIVDRINQGTTYSHEDLLCIADQVIEEEKPMLLRLTTKDKSPHGK